MKEILKVPNDTLRQKSEPIGEVTKEVIELSDDLGELLGVLHDGRVAVSIAAPQIGALMRIFVFRTNPCSQSPGRLTVINPEIVYAKGDVTLKEACLSMPGKTYLVKRHKIVKIKYLGLDGKPHSYKSTGILAQALEHEINHLDGILIDSKGTPIDEYGLPIQEHESHESKGSGENHKPM